MRKVLIAISVISIVFVVFGWGKIGAQQQQQDDFRKQIGTIIVTPGAGPSLAVADFQSRASGADAVTTSFNEVLWNDLKFAGVANLVGKSLYPKTKLADPASLKYDEWVNDPVKSDYVVFGSITGANSAQGYLYDVKTQSQLLTASLAGNAREMAHQFADQIVKLLTGQDGIAQSKIAYIANREVFMMDYDGYGGRQFTRDGSIALFPSLSPDGKRLAYVSYRSGFPNVVVRGEDGLIIGSTQFKGTTTSPSVAPDGRIVFSSSKDGGSMELFVANEDGSGARKITRSRSVSISPRWNPKTGREIAFVSDRGGFHIYLADVASGQALRLTREGRNENPTWSPDSRHIAFQSNRTGRWEIWAMHIDGSEPRQLTRTGGRSPSWSK